MTKRHAGDSADFVIRDRAWLEVRRVPDGLFDQVQHYEGSVKIAGDLLLESDPSACVVVDGDLDVDGDVYVCNDGLVVTGEVRCSTFESWDSRFVIARAIRARRDIVFTALGGAAHDIATFEAPIVACLGVDREELLGSGAHRIEHFVDLSDAPDGVGDAMVLELLRTKTDEVLALLGKRKPIWSLFPDRPPARLVKMVETIRAGATFEWTDLAGRPAIRIIGADGSRQISALSIDERATLERMLGAHA